MSKTPLHSHQIPKIWKKKCFMPGEAPNILKAKFLTPSNLGGGPFFGFGLLFQHSWKHFCDFHLSLFLSFGDVWRSFGKKGPGVLENSWKNIGCKAAHRAQVKSKSLFLILNAHPAGLGPPEPCLYPPELQFEFVRSYSRCTKFLT